MGGSEALDMSFRLTDEFISDANRGGLALLEEDYAHLSRQLARRNVDIERLTDRAMRLRLSVPSWGVGTGGTRFARFPGPGEPRNVLEKLDDCCVIHQLSRATPRVSLHIPWDRTDDFAALREQAATFGLGLDR